MCARFGRDYNQIKFSDNIETFIDKSSICIILDLNYRLSMEVSSVNCLNFFFTYT